MKRRDIPFIMLAVGCFLLMLPMAAAYNTTGIPLLLYITIVLNLGWVVFLILYFVASKDMRVVKKAKRETKKAEEAERSKNEHLIIECPFCLRECNFEDDTCSRCGFDLQTYKQEIENTTYSDPAMKFLGHLLLAIFFAIGAIAYLVLAIAGDVNAFIGIIITAVFGFFTVGFTVTMRDDIKDEKLERVNPFLLKYRRHKEIERKKKSEEATFQFEKDRAFHSQRPDAAPWETKYSTHPCPNCGHYTVRATEWEDIQLSVAFWGVASDKIGKAYKCEKCGKMW